MLLAFRPLPVNWGGAQFDLLDVGAVLRVQRFKLVWPGANRRQVERVARDLCGAGAA